MGPNHWEIKIPDKVREQLKEAPQNAKNESREKAAKP